MSGFDLFPQDQDVAIATAQANPATRLLSPPEQLWLNVADRWSWIACAIALLICIKYRKFLWVSTRAILISALVLTLKSIRKIRAAIGALWLEVEDQIRK